jgi:RTA1 like protein
MAAGTLSAMNTGAHIVIGGLAIQLLFFGFFAYVAAQFHFRMKRTAPTADGHLQKWESMMYILYAACLLIFVRSVFRVVEFVQGNDGYIMQREYLLYIFDALLMASQAVLILVVYPGKVLCRGKGNEIQLCSRSDSSNSFIASAI